MKLPPQLQDNRFRFYLLEKNTKNRIIHKDWNGENNYLWDSHNVQQHTGNIGVVCGIGGLVVLDFDHEEFLWKIAPLLPRTFTVRTPNKKLLHYYYILEEFITKREMIATSRIKMYGLDMGDGQKQATLLDIQAARSGVLCPPSIINRTYYDVFTPVPIATISILSLKSILSDGGRIEDTGESEPRTPLVKPYNGTRKVIDDPKQVATAVRLLNDLGIRHKTGPLYQCPFHSMDGLGNLALMPSGNLWCFHESKWWDIWGFAFEYARFKGDHKLGQRLYQLRMEMRS